jgi:hypothetical protein
MNYSCIETYLCTSILYTERQLEIEVKIYQIFSKETLIKAQVRCFFPILQKTTTPSVPVKSTRIAAVYQLFGVFDVHSMYVALKAR